MTNLLCAAYWHIARFDLYLARGRFSALYEAVRSYPCHRSCFRSDNEKSVCAAIDLACIWYWKEVLCLQRSAATVCLLRKYGVPARMAIGAQYIPFKAHAWVEVDSRVVNDKTYIPDLYAVLDRC